MSDTTSLPTQDLDISDNGLLTDYVIRVTSHGKFTKEQLADFLKGEPQLFRYVVGRETVPQEHYHIVCSVDPSVSEEDVRGIIRAFLIPLWQVDFKLPKGFGNKQYNLQITQTLDSAVSYAIKTKEFWYDGFTPEYIEQRLNSAFEKKKPSNFKSEYLLLCKLFQESPMDISEFMVAYCNLKAKYDQQISMHHAYGYALSNIIKRDQTADYYVDNFLYKQ